MALDISLYEATEANNGVSSNLIAGFGSDYLDIWRNLGVVDFAVKVSKLRWGGTFTGYPDGVHFDAFSPTEYLWAGSNGLAVQSLKFINEAYPNLRNLFVLDTQNKGRGNTSLGTYFTDVLDTRNVMLLGKLNDDPELTTRINRNNFGLSTDRSLLKGSTQRISLFNQDSKFTAPLDTNPDLTKKILNK